MRKILALTLLCGALVAPAAAAVAAATRPAGPVVDIVEIAGLLDRHIAAYATEQINIAERKDHALLVFQIDSLGGSKISDEELLPPLVRRVRDARIPVAVFIGPRGARAQGTAAFLAEAADVVAIGQSARFGPAYPTDLSRRSKVFTGKQQADAFADLARASGRAPTASMWIPRTANESVRLGVADLVAPNVANMLQRISGRVVQTARGSVTLDLPSATTVVRFSQPGPIRRFLHAFANTSLLYLCLLIGLGLVVFELFQPGFGIAGITGGLFIGLGVFGLTEVPAQREGLIAIAISILLLTWDVVRDELLLPTIGGIIGLAAGSYVLFDVRQDAVRISNWVIGLTVASAFIFFVPVMTMVRRAVRTPIAPETKARLIGEPGMVRSVLNPEGFVMVGGELWRARAEDGGKHKAGARVVVSAVQGAVLLVREADLELSLN